MIRLADIDILARSVWGEARGEPSFDARWGVACVIVNRWKSKKWFAGDTLEATCKFPWQISSWNRGDPNRQKMLDVTYDDRHLRECMEAAMKALNGSPHLWLTDDVYHYFNDSIVKPHWAEGKTPAGRLGSHLFFAGID